MLKEQDYVCYETVPKPNVIHSCYLTAPDGAEMAVRMRAAADGEVVEVTLKGRQSGTRGSTSPDPRGDVLEPSKDALTAISHVLLSVEDTKHLQVENVRVTKRISVPWGSVQVGLSTQQAFASFVRAGSKPLGGKHPLPVPREEVVRGLRAAGFVCEGDFSLNCGKRDVNVSIRETVILLAVWGHPPLADTVVAAHTETLLQQVAKGATRDAVTSWAKARLNPEYGFVQGDVGGLHIEIVRDESITHRDAAEVIIHDARSAL
ncbi:hypothetical protein [Actinopolymorpha pittospori]|uniref:Uncharacterized protein n=1 Tax=Actinopolymorpha pittospori TaxID=648752 RepID=A0A927RIX8_9ACTN|nr:hypothetical protein [Actinopolymorpha pittospori]MBE1605028.1 hypothetical protein [Actinopolymorpha pittospori]